MRALAALLAVCATASLFLSATVLVGGPGRERRWIALTWACLVASLLTRPSMPAPAAGVAAALSMLAAACVPLVWLVRAPRR